MPTSEPQSQGMNRKPYEIPRTISPNPLSLQSLSTAHLSWSAKTHLDPENWSRLIAIYDDLGAAHINPKLRIWVQSKGIFAAKMSFINTGIPVIESAILRLLHKTGPQP